MIARILKKKSMTFAGVRYNTDKMELNKGELMVKANFGALQGLTHPRPQDLINYLQMVSAQNTRVKKNTQFHAVISGGGGKYNKHELTRVAVSWLDEMKYGSQPYLVVYHKDTLNNHVHIVSSRIDKNGKKIDSAFEHDRAVKAIDKVLGYTFALQYRFSTIAQFYLLLENQGYPGRDYRDHKELLRRINKYVPDKTRIAVLKALFEQERGRPDFVQFLKSNYHVDLVFHSSEGKKPYGYTVIDHASRQVFKGSEILNLKHLQEVRESNITAFSPRSDYHAVNTGEYPQTSHDLHTTQPVYVGPVMIADDVDDQQVLGMKRRRQKKARTNTR